jgi:hypothetical protein
MSFLSIKTNFQAGKEAFVFFSFIRSKDLRITSIIDLDMTGLPLYAISIGVISLAGNRPEVVAGVIYNPVSSKDFQ